MAVYKLRYFSKNRCHGWCLAMIVAHRSHARHMGIPHRPSHGCRRTAPLSHQCPDWGKAAEANEIESMFYIIILFLRVGREMEPPDAMLNIKYVYMKSVFRVWGVIEMRVFFLFCFVFSRKLSSHNRWIASPKRNVFENCVESVAINLVPISQRSQHNFHHHCGRRRVCAYCTTMNVGA